jgi:hypothetical protein
MVTYRTGDRAANAKHGTKPVVRTKVTLAQNSSRSLGGPKLLPLISSSHARTVNSVLIGPTVLACHFHRLALRRNILGQFLVQLSA